MSTTNQVFAQPWIRQLESLHKFWVINSGECNIGLDDGPAKSTVKFLRQRAGNQSYCDYVNAYPYAALGVVIGTINHSAQESIILYGIANIELINYWSCNFGILEGGSWRMLKVCRLRTRCRYNWEYDEYEPLRLRQHVSPCSTWSGNRYH